MSSHRSDGSLRSDRSVSWANWVQSLLIRCRFNSNHIWSGVYWGVWSTLIRSPISSDHFQIRPLSKSDYPGRSSSRPIRLQRKRTWSTLIGREVGCAGTSVVISNWSGRTTDLIRRLSELGPAQSWSELSGSLIKGDQTRAETWSKVSRTISKWSELHRDQMKGDLS